MLCKLKEKELKVEVTHSTTICGLWWTEKYRKGETSFRIPGDRIFRCKAWTSYGYILYLDEITANPFYETMYFDAEDFEKYFYLNEAELEKELVLKQ